MTLISKERLRRLRERKQDEPESMAGGEPVTQPTYEAVCDDDPGLLLRCWRFIHSRHTWGVELVFALVLALFALTCWACFKRGPKALAVTSLDDMGKLVTILLSPLLFVTALQFLYSTGVKRRGSVAMMRSEIVSIARLFAAANIVGDFIDLYSRSCYARDTSKLGFASVAGKESYMTVFDKNIEHLGSLHAVLLDHIAAFYSFLKASRDATGALANWNDAYPTRRKLDDIVDIIYLCFLTMMHGHHAVNRLFEKSDKARADLVKDVFTGLELQCYLFLLLAVDKADYRYAALTSRYGYYAHLADRFCYVDLFLTVPMSTELKASLRKFAKKLGKTRGDRLELRMTRAAS
nr:hypothetical protein [uncultured Duganella sp.]